MGLPRQPKRSFYNVKNNRAGPAGLTDVRKRELFNRELISLFTIRVRSYGNNNETYYV